MQSELTIAIAFGAGLLSFFSPCTLPMLPLYLSYTTGRSIAEIKEQKDKSMLLSILSHSIVFLLGVSLVYLALGLGAFYASNHLGTILTPEAKLLGNRLTGVLILLFGFVTLGWIQIPSLLKDTRKMSVKKAGNYLSTFIIGLGFSAGWTPCIGPIFTSIVLLGSTSPAPTLGYLFAYIIGFAIPFLILSLFIGKLPAILKYTETLMKIGGFCLVIIGGLMVSGFYYQLVEFLL